MSHGRPAALSHLPSVTIKVTAARLYACLWQVQLAASQNLRLLSGARATGVDISEGSITGMAVNMVVNAECIPWAPPGDMARCCVYTDTAMTSWSVPMAAGVQLADGRRLQADLVVDASGRGSPTPGWLEAAGYQPPPEVRLETK